MKNIKIEKQKDKMSKDIEVDSVKEKLISMRFN